MADKRPIVTQLYIKVDGAQVAEGVMDDVAEVVVDQHSHLPDMFTIRLYDTQLAYLDEGPFDLTREVEIRAEDGQGNAASLIKGEITALEPNFEKGMVAELVVRGYDKSHRLYRETRSCAFLNKKDSDLANEIAQRLGLRAEVETTSTVYDHIYQHNQSDLSFLMERAWRIGYECFVSDDTLYFRRPPGGGEAVQLKWGDDLHWFRPRMTLAEQVDEVVVKGWDVAKQTPIVGQARKGQLYPDLSEEKDGAGWAGAFGNGRMVIVDMPVVTQSEADALAAARLDELSGAFVMAEGEAFRRPDIKAGKSVTLAGLGQRLSGSYLVTSASHLYNNEGFRTTFTIRGARNGLLLEQAEGQAPRQRWPGVVVGVVTNSEDPEGWGRVKVKFPWMADDAESDWARVIGIGAGQEAGLFVMPEVGDEVLVAFEHGDFSRPAVLGGVWNGQSAPPPEGTGAAQDEKPLVRSWRSRTGHRLTMYDNNDNKVELVTAGGHSFTLDDAGGKVEIKSKSGVTISIDDNSGKVTIEGNGDISVSSQSNIDVKSSANLKLEAGANVEIKAGAQVNVKGAMINLN